MEILPV